MKIKRRSVPILLIAVIIVLLIFWLLPHTAFWNTVSARLYFQRSRETIEETLEQTPIAEGSVQDVLSLMQGIPHGKAFRVRTEENESPVCLLRTADYGDFYQYFYWFGLLRTEKPESFPSDILTLTPLNDSWYVYMLKLPQ